MTISLNIIFAIILGGGWLFSRFFSAIRFPSIVGMVVFGIICSALLGSYTPEILWEIAPMLKSFALIVILLRAGLGIRKSTLKKIGHTAVLMSFIPCLIEGFSLMLLFRYFLDFSWHTAGLTGFMLDLKDQGHDEVPTIILAGASLDDVLSITLFSVFLHLSLETSSTIINTIISIPLSIALGIISGIILGSILAFIYKKKYTAIRATEKVMILLVLGTLLVQVGSVFHFAALLGIMTTGFILLEKTETIAHELSAKLSKLWVVAEIILFVLIGYSLDISVALTAGIQGILIISGGLLFRSLGVLIATAFSGLNIRERLFCMIAYLPKATVQAALGGIALSYNLPEGQLILALAVISILFTAPLGLFGIKFIGPQLLADNIQSQDLKTAN